MTSIWGVSVVAILDSSVNCVCMWSTKKLTMPAYCVAANCNNLKMTPGITMHEFLRNRPAVIKFIQFKWSDFLAALHHAHLCSEHLVSAISQTPWNTGTPSKSCLAGSNWYSCILVGLLGKSISFVFGAWVGHFAATPQSDVVGIWSCDLGIMVTLSVQQKMPFLRAFITFRSQFHLHHRSQRV